MLCKLLFRQLLFLIAPIFLISLSGCGGNQNAIYESLRLAFTNPNTVIDSSPINPNYRYLRADVNNNPALLVLGYVDADPDGPIDVWYSAMKETIKIQNGRLLSTHGLDKNWIEVKLIQAPPLAAAFDPQLIEAAELAVSKKNRNLPNPLSYTRIRTVMPGYRARIEETVFLKALTEAPGNAPDRLKEGPYSGKLRWVEERARPKVQSANNPGLAVVTAVYAVDMSGLVPRPIYGRQCLSPDYCLSWLTWPWPPSSAVKS